MAGMDPAALQAQMAQAQAMMSGMSPDQLRGQFAEVHRSFRVALLLLLRAGYLWRYHSFVVVSSGPSIQLASHAPFLSN